MAIVPERATVEPASLPPRVLLLGAGDRPNVRREADRLRPFIQQHAQIVLEDFSFSADLSSQAAELAVVLGGDGSILRAARQMGNCQVPVVGVNLGKLGFLADLTPEQFLSEFAGICARRFHVVRHLMLSCSVWRDGGRLYDELGLNEAAILAGPPFSMLNVDLYVDAELATTYSCDGLIISTPVGSTAHNLSAGGPILRKSLEAFVVSAISPHTLTVRPVVDSADRVFEAVVREPKPMTSLVVDGRVICQLTSADRVRVMRAAPSFLLVETAGRGAYRTLREKLGWGGELQARRADAES